jgi:hypothetical protein
MNFPRLVIISTIFRVALVCFCLCFTRNPSNVGIQGLFAGHVVSALETPFIISKHVRFVSRGICFIEPILRVCCFCLSSLQTHFAPSLSSFYSSAIISPLPTHPLIPILSRLSLISAIPRSTTPTPHSPPHPLAPSQQFIPYSTLLDESSLRCHLPHFIFHHWDYWDSKEGTQKAVHTWPYCMFALYFSKCVWKWSIPAMLYYYRRWHRVLSIHLDWAFALALTLRDEREVRHWNLAGSVIWMSA